MGRPSNNFLLEQLGLPRKRIDRERRHMVQIRHSCGEHDSQCLHRASGKYPGQPGYTGKKRIQHICWWKLHRAGGRRARRNLHNLLEQLYRAPIAPQRDNATDKHRECDTSIFNTTTDLQLSHNNPNIPSNLKRGAKPDIQRLCL